MERNFGVKVETRQTVKLRSNFNRKRRFLSRFYKTDWVKVPTRTELVLYIILLFVGLVILSSYSDLTEIFRVLIVCSILTLLYRITCYFKNKNGWLHMRLAFRVLSRCDISNPTAHNHCPIYKLKCIVYAIARCFRQSGTEADDFFRAISRTCFCSLELLQNTYCNPVKAKV